MREAAIVTGASSGIGREIARELCVLGYEVYGFGRQFAEVDPCGEPDGGCHGAIHRIACDITDTDRMAGHVREIRAVHPVKILVNNAGVGYYGLHEELNAAKIKEMVRTNLEAPMVLTNLLLRDLKKQEGYIINIASVTAVQSNPHGCAYGATKAGLASFAHSLFDEARKYGVKVVNIQPDMAKTNLYRNADFTAADEPDACLLPQDVAEAVRYVLGCRPGMAVTDITLKPQRHRIVRRTAERHG